MNSGDPRFDDPRAIHIERTIDSPDAAAKLVSDVRGAMVAYRELERALRQFADTFDHLGYTEAEIDLLLAAITEKSGFNLS